MKTLPCILLLLSLSIASAAPEPEELLRLRKAWEKSLSDADRRAKDVYKSKTLAANKLYYEELTAMKDNFMEAKNLQGAIAVDAEIKKLVELHGKQDFEVQLITEKTESLLEVQKLAKYLTGKVWSIGDHHKYNKVEFFDNGTFRVNKDWSSRFAVIGPKSITLKWGPNTFINCIMSEDLLSFHELNGMRNTWQLIGTSKP